MSNFRFLTRLADITDETNSEDRSGLYEQHDRELEDGISNMGTSITALQTITGAWTTFSPTLTQSTSVTLTTATGRYLHFGYVCHLHIFLNPSGTGTAGNDMIIGNIPAAIAPRTSGAIAGGDFDGDIGVGTYHDSGSALYLLHCYFASSSTLRLQHSAEISGANFGAAPAVTVAAGDSLSLTIVYETLTSA